MGFVGTWVCDRCEAETRNHGEFFGFSFREGNSSSASITICSVCFFELFDPTLVEFLKSQTKEDRVPMDCQPEQCEAVE